MMETEDIVAQTIYLNQHLDKVITQATCNIELACVDNFGKDCQEPLNDQDY